MRRLPVDLGQLAAAFDAPAGGPTRAFLDRESGEIEFVPRDVEVSDFEDVLADRKRWVEVLPRSRFARLRLRARFVETVDDVLLRPALLAALDGDGRHVLRDFDRAVRLSQEVRDRWLRFRDQELTREGRRWLAETLAIDAI